ncbi:hypothetical protein [Streptomyces sp. GbtcB7]|uniref:hypothetical protein n=1 Tax=Streptomyces sp. GbtcB7 TaxID=2824752 RepID=UPI001C2F7CC7|nr:hypothetical protein [Streptomyces sp. GbtcB7]
MADHHSHHDRQAQQEHDRIEASWRERALNAEAEPTRTQKEGFAQRQRQRQRQRQPIGELLGQLCDFDLMVPGESVQHLTTENTILKHRVRQLAQEHRKLQERLEGARSNLRFADKRITDLEVQLLERDQT